MNVKIEEEIIRTFIKKEKQDRILWELSSKKHRENVVSNRFSSTSILKAECFYILDFPTEDSFRKCLLSLGGRKESYFLGSAHMGECTLTEGWKYMNGGEMGILYCGNGVGYYLEEPMPFKMQGYLLLGKGIKYPKG